MTEKIEIRAIIEMLGAPKEHIEKTLKEYIEKLKDDGKKITSEIFEEAEQKEENLYSSFAEIEILFDNMGEVLEFCFDSMPSSIEIISPEKLIFNSNILTGFLNDFQAKIHSVDALLKKTSIKQQLLDTNAVNILHNFIYYMLKNGEKTTKEISENIGLNEKETKSFLDHMVKKKLIIENGDKYSATPKA
jgi:hypothetical protein